LIFYAVAAVLEGLFKYDTTISVGNIITIGSILLISAAAWFKLGNRVSNSEEHLLKLDKWIEIHEVEVATRQDLVHRLDTSVALLNQSMSLLTGSMTDLNRRLTDQEFSANRERRNNRNTKAS
jgi:hypothetical protein